MLRAYRPAPRGLMPIPPDADLSQAIWIDLYRPMPVQIAAVAALGVNVPSLEDMEEIEISNRLYHEEDSDVLTVVLPGQTPDGVSVSGPVTFILAPGRLVTVRHHAPRPFDTFPDRSEGSTTGSGSRDRLFLGLIEEIISRLADLLEGAGRVIDQTARRVFDDDSKENDQTLQQALRLVGQQSELNSRVRLAILSLSRALSFYGANVDHRPEADVLRQAIKMHGRDLQSLEVHADFLSARVGLVVDATMGMINLRQNATVRILSVVAALFLPPTLIASIYGMNFDVMPELHESWGYPASLGAMLASAVLTWLFLKWKKWL
ncbi:magnesium transporter CorA family protein [Paracoccus sp. p4-l81]|uniref:magnesium transporter CorA family protein n=1 Tax=Paracoccus sp. p4-l81 TaxID=3342806 RepID=UPI0035BB6086